MEGKTNKLVFITHFSGPTRVGATHERFYQMAEGHVPRPPAMVETLTYIKEFMNQVELHS